ncbi:Polyribonucleotide 5'-hydroxyl-kinase Clp1 [Seminavis robusta]|uniref:Polyribonucleotide 5'-hydroxyl-kinase Clp1 n=1 Tax=Seminavis robusta TaxID=568900 RepID=A0A9N8DV26_9STRA|nr:Polyribonucleotide 5'-hydroxyl-kinase Clp1 [Seminavis robusta]|eukprot:Sro392_g133410.1 Polyribonucleotide 5'-hydroxyl-kinase Clp1 (496) ;mRNA; f:39515-41002
MTETAANPANTDTSDLPEPTDENCTRHVLQAEEELRLEVSFLGTKIETTCVIELKKGSCELWGVELALQKKYTLDGGFKAALFTWHGCVVDVTCEHLDISYSSNETAANVAYVNTHAQLEALRDDAAMNGQEGPRVLIVGPPESGKSSLTKILVAYATKLGRTPLWVDLDPADNGVSVPGTLAAVPMAGDSAVVETYATGGIPIGTTPLVLFHGTTTLQPELYKAQVTALADKIQLRLDAQKDVQPDENNNPGAAPNFFNERSSGIIVNTNGWIQDEGFQLLLHTINVMKITVVLIMGHDRLYSMMSNHIKKIADTAVKPKIIKLPRSGGTVSREAAFLRQARSRSMKRYFYGDMVEPTQQQQQGATTTTTRVPQLTPFLNQIPFKELTLYKLSAIALSASLLPVGMGQSTDSIQVQEVELSESLQHALVAVCHPHAVAAYQKSGRARDLFQAGAAGFCAIERVVMDTDTVHLLCPCAGNLPSKTLLLGDITWME